jgi:hypothetical protein
MKEKVKVYVLLDMDAPIGDQKVLIGTINDIRIWAKNLWKQDSEWIKDSMSSVVIEEDYYRMLDDDDVLINILLTFGYVRKEICEVPFDDFYDGEKPSQELIDEVIEQIKKDIGEGDTTALDVMLNALPVQTLMGYLPEK